LDSSTGVLGASTDAGDSFGENLGLAVATPSGKFLYVQGFYQFLAYNAVFCFSITGAGGQLTSLGPFPISAGTPNGIAMDGQGRFLYVSEYVGMVSDISGQQTNTIQAYSIDPGTEDLLEGPVLTSTSTTVGLLSAQAIDPDSRYLYTATGLSNGYAISVYAIDPVTATLTEVQGSPFFADSLTEGIGYSQRVFVSPR
jgi:6-phosphogluconolactonase (cycloisomerase 2 family)